MVRKTGLGRGLDALIPAEENPPGSAEVILVPIEAISPNPHQPRGKLSPESLDELAASIREHGIIQPLIVTRGTAPGTYILIAGERRWLAARQSGLAFVPAILREAGDQQMLEIALVENIQRADLNPLETAEAYRQLNETFSMEHEEIALRVGKSRSAVTNTLRLLKLPDPAKQALVDGLIDEGHARTLLSLPTLEAQTAALQMIIRHGLTVRQAEELVRKMSGQKPPHPSKPPVPPEFVDIEERLRQALGTRVNLNPHKKGGTLVIHYYSEEELNSLVAKITGAEV